MRLIPIALAAAVLAATSAQAAPSLIAIGSLSATTSDLSGLTGNLESGVSASLLGGMGSALAWAGGSTFLALPDRGPNADVYNTAVDLFTGQQVPVPGARSRPFQSQLPEVVAVILKLRAAPGAKALGRSSGRRARRRWLWRRKGRVGMVHGSGRALCSARVPIKPKECIPNRRVAPCRLTLWTRYA